MGEQFLLDVDTEIYAPWLIVEDDIVERGE